MHSFKKTGNSSLALRGGAAGFPAETPGLFQAGRLLPEDTVVGEQLGEMPLRLASQVHRGDDDGAHRDEVVPVILGAEGEADDDADSQQHIGDPLGMLSGEGVGFLPCLRVAGGKVTAVAVEFAAGGRREEADKATHREKQDPRQDIGVEKRAVDDGSHRKGFALSIYEK